MSNKNGVINDVPHIRDYDYEIVCGVSATEYPEEYEIPRENTGTLKNQGTVGACVAEVCVQIAEEWWRREFGEQVEHSEGWFYGTNRDDNSISEGMIPSSSLDHWCKKGTLPKSLFDILVCMPDMKKICKEYPELIEEAKKYRLSSYVRIKSSVAATRDVQIKDALMKYQYGLVAISNNGFSGGSHCILLTGWNDKKDKYKYKNSWGEKYGDKGFAEISKDKIDAVYVPIFEPITLPFTDVSDKDWYYKNLKNMYFSGMIKGKTDTTFAPNDNVTRAELVAVMDRMAKENEERFELLAKLIEDKMEYNQI